MKHTPMEIARYTNFGRALVLAPLGLLAYPASAQNYTIPVVFHVLYTNSIENISDAQLMDGLNILNTCFNETSSGPVTPPFDTIAANMGIEFCLATTAPDGSATEGIDRIETPWAHHGGVPESYMNQWPRDRYLNIWVVGSTEFGVYGAGSFPPEAVNGDPSKDGIMIDNGFVGSMGTGSQLDAKVIVSLAGLYLNLKLLWADPTGTGDCGDDDVADTPPCEPITDCLGGDLSCQEGIGPNTENYMTYSYCNTMFTQGQVERAYAALNSGVAQRNNLWTSGNLALTGCGPEGIAETLAPVARNMEVDPLPTEDQWLVHFPIIGSWTLCAFDALGRPVGTWHSSGPSLIVNLSTQAPGTYLFRATSTTGEFRSAKVIRP